MTGRRFSALLAGLLAVSLVLAAGASAAKRAVVSASKSSARACHTKFVGDRAHTDVVRATASADGLVRARLKSRGDWDVGVFDARTKRTVAGSAGFRGNELAEGAVTKGQRLLVQACRFRGKSSAARVSVDFLGLSASPVQGAVQVVDVSTPTRADKQRLQTLGLDLTEHGDADSIEVVLYGNEDAQTLRDAKFRYSVRIADLDARVEANRRADRRFAARAAQNGGSQPAQRADVVSPPA